MKTSNEINELAAALAKAQSHFETAARDHKAKVETKSGKDYEFNYADFAAYLEVCRKPLADQGLSFVQEAVSSDKEVSVVTRLMHQSGQWIETEPLKLPLVPDSRGAITAQIVGSGVTYAKRYSLSSLIGLASEADDDGNQASGNSAETTKREPLPDCPKCGTNKSVIVGKPEYGGGYVCFGKKGGCGAKWQDPVAKANEIASEHGMTTGDKVPPPAKSKAPEAKSMYQIALGMIGRINASERIDVFKDWLLKNHSTMTAEELDDIDAKLVDVGKKFSEPQAA